MKIGKSIGNSFRFLTDFRRWMGWRQVKNSAKNIADMAKTIGSTAEPTHKETFEQAVQRLKLDEEKLNARASRLLGLALFFALITILLFVYTIYLLYTAHFQGFLLGLVVTVLASSLAFREHFHYFQIKQKHLGGDVKAWLNFCLGRAKK